MTGRELRVVFNVEKKIVSVHEIPKIELSDLSPIINLSAAKDRFLVSLN